MKNSTRSILPTLLAVGGGLASAPASAIELGEISVQSTLGQPLRASIAYALGPNESLAGYCVTLDPRAAANGLPAITRADLSVADGVIVLTSTDVVREPLMAARLNISCPYAANLSRDYMLFFDPAQPAQALGTQAAPAATVRAASSAPTSSAPTVSAPTARATAKRAAVNRTPIDSSERYRVQPGDSLSHIAQRIENRSVGLWSAVAQLFDANPNAFIDSDPNRLKAGSWLLIPDFAPQAEFAKSTEIPAPVEPDAGVRETAYTAYPSVTETPATNEVIAPEEPAVIVEDFVAESVEDSLDDTATLEPASIPSMADLQPGDVILDAEIEVPSTASNANVPVATIISANAPIDEQAQSGTNWLLWFIGGGIALIAGLLVFGRRGRQTPAPAQVQPQRRSTDNDTVTEQLEPVADVDYDLTDDSPTEENLILDADLEIGTGLDKSTDVDVAQDFGFAVTTHLDLELPEEAAQTEDAPETDIIAPVHVEDSSILKNEVLPEDDDDDDYDMSVIVDATKMPAPEEVTERDLMAVVVNNGDETLISGDYTISKEADYDIIEQDYEDEMTATQALNMEIERAAAEIAERMENDEATEQTGEMTSELPLATVTALDVTANLPAGNDDDADTDTDTDEDTGVNLAVTEEMLADEKTVEMPASKSDKKTG